MNLFDYPKFKGTFASNSLKQPEAPADIPWNAGNPFEESVEAPAGGTPAKRALTRNTVGYALGRGAQAVMGEFKDSPAALLGGLGAELNQDEAFRSTARRLLAGEDLEGINEASILSPEQLIVAVETADKRKMSQHKIASDRLDYELKLKQLGLSQAEFNSRMAQWDKEFGLKQRETAVAERKQDLAEKTTPTPEQEHTNALERIEASGEQTRKNISAQAQASYNNVEKELKLKQEKGEVITDADWLRAALTINNSIAGDVTITDPAAETVRRMNNLRTMFGATPYQTPASQTPTTDYPKGKVKLQGRGYVFEE